MFDRFNPALKVVCLALAVVVVSQIARLALAKNPLEPLSFSTLPVLPAAPKTQTEKKGTNAAPARPLAKDDAGVPPAIQARVERITQSEVLGAVVRPLPMALLGIAGQDVFLRTPDGQTGLLREGEELGGVKLLRIGTNRVLIEHEQQQKELSVFSGFGSEPLLPKGKANPQ
jgi:hypothetical protein